MAPSCSKTGPWRPAHLRTLAQTSTGGDYLQARQTLLGNADVTMSICNPTEQRMDYYYKNALADEVIFVHEGRGELWSQLGKLAFEPGDYIVVPRTIIHQMHFEEGPVRLLIIESFSPVETCRRYRNHFGQLLEHAPYCERDFRAPSELIDGRHARVGRVRGAGARRTACCTRLVYGHSPFDVVGWDGYFYPYATSIHDFEPITGRIHQPPPVHQQFEGNNFVICSFVPRLVRLPPAGHSGALQPLQRRFRRGAVLRGGQLHVARGVDLASFTWHPSGIPHGPHPGTVEASIGKKETHELAVMLDTFRPLYLTEAALAYEDESTPIAGSPKPQPAQSGGHDGLAGNT